MNEVKVINRAKLAVKRATTQDMITGEDLKAIIVFTNRELAELKGSPLDNYDISLLASYAIAFN